MPRKTNDKLLQAQAEPEITPAEMESGAMEPQLEIPFAVEPEGASDETVPAQTGEPTEDAAMEGTERIEPSLDETEPAEEPIMEQQSDFPEQELPQAVPKLATKTPKPKKTTQPTDKTATEQVPQKPKNARQAFYSLDFRALDRDLSPEQEQEWNGIYASFRSRSILTGTVIGVDDHTFDITGEDGVTERKTVRSLVIIGYRVKVMIPETEVWAVGEEPPRYAIRGMVGAKVDYVVMSVDRENDCAIASRRMAMTKRRRYTLQTARPGRDMVSCDTIMVAHKALLVNCGGFDLVLTQKDLSYTAIADLQNEYKPGMELRARLLDMRDGKPVVSVKEVNPNPFDGADHRHPVGCRRQAVIEGKYGGGVFCRLPDDTTCLCLYSNNHYDTQFESGDTVLVHITDFDYNRKLIYGRIVGKR